MLLNIFSVSIKHNDLAVLNITMGLHTCLNMWKTAVSLLVLVSLKHDSPFMSNTYIYISLRLSVCLSVGVRKLQVAILARSAREMSLTVSVA